MSLVVLPEAAQGRSIRITPLAVGHTAAVSGDARTADALRRALRHAVAEHPRLRLVEDRHARYVVRGSVTRLIRSDDGVHCEISLMVSVARTGELRLLLSARGALETGSPPDAAQQAMRAAVTPVLGRLPAILQRLP